MIEALKNHWPEYLMELAGPGDLLDFDLPFRGTPGIPGLSAARAAPESPVSACPDGNSHGSHGDRARVLGLGKAVGRPSQPEHLRGAQECRCAELHHENTKRCIFQCGYADTKRAGSEEAA
jgi:hypothetical protein